MSQWFLLFPQFAEFTEFLLHLGETELTLFLKIDNYNWKDKLRVIVHVICVFHDRRFCQIIWQIFTQGKVKKIFKNCPQWDWKPGPLDLQANALPTELC